MKKLCFVRRSEAELFSTGGNTCVFNFVITISLGKGDRIDEINGKI
jgi:hypothetical protein